MRLEKPDSLKECILILKGFKYRNTTYPEFTLSYNQKNQMWNCKYRHPIDFKNPLIRSNTPLDACHQMIHFLNQKFRDHEKQRSSNTTKYLSPYGRSLNYPWRDQKVGDSFIAVERHTFLDMRSEQQHLGNAARNFCKKSPDCQDWKFSTKQVPEGIMITRIK